MRDSIRSSVEVTQASWECDPAHSAVQTLQPNNVLLI
jgi:hypothetical protein